MSSFQEASSSNTLQTSNFAHVIFQNVAKSYLPNVYLECHYTLTPYIHPHQKDWVGIFKVGWSTARDYYTFLWSPMPENYVEGSTINCVLSFQGYYLPNDDGEFYQFCYVTHKGEIRGASTPFQFRTSSPVEELLTMEDEGNSDMLVVTTKSGLLEFKIEKILKEKEELLKVTASLEKETVQLRDQVERLEKELVYEKERCDKLEAEQKDGFEAAETLKAENEKLKKKYEEATSKVIQLEEDIMIVTQKAIIKETELDSLKDKLKKVVLEKEQFECQLKTEKDEKELYKIHLKNTEVENCKLASEIQTLKNLDGNKENLIAYYKEEIGRLQLCVTEKEKLKKAFLLTSSNKEESSFLKEQLRKAEDQIQASRQEVIFMSKELSDAVNVRDKTMADLHTARLENENLKKQLNDAVAELKKISPVNNEQGTSNVAERELRREVEDLKLRLQMAADHYKEKFKECQKLQKQVNKYINHKTSGDQLNLTDGSKKEISTVEAGDKTLPTSPVSIISSDTVLEFSEKEQDHEKNKEISDRTVKFMKCKPMLSDEKLKCTMYADELAKLELKWKEQVKISESVKEQLAVVKDQYLMQLAEKDKKIDELTSHLGVHNNEKKPGRRPENQTERIKEGQISQQALHFLNPDLNSEDNGQIPATLPSIPLLHYGNPYTSQETRGGADDAFYPDDIQRPPMRTASWDLEDNVVCSQPARNFSRPEGLEDLEDNNVDEASAPSAPDPSEPHLRERGTGFCFDSSFVHIKKCPLCEVMFPPNYDQSKFEEHVESHWKVCPMCREQFPPDFDQQTFENHVQTHFDHVLNFD
ncbi:PREDICTED: tax1-binding protein 1 isoform X1 [Thamnophis sirtalis]|uniref:Tax1-binding protein 1 isoform X1 n=1 Tax=Thamnophis sirtalis TaxID=35019 RepID=A0A6I9X2C6_9SAUR|nr:PREDICTED: tax1-binding protein 1 isoform X1 [Thamnophis sirtalis]XP_013907983.1 PREDICTED: tax1-binding protein 1 isoform X1 [Thamnophis sirtalis]XP_013907984.1 PREDICTED: tax1-binding protein 1 isoform X1 [Thamnophis sirtalis]